MVEALKARPGSSPIQVEALARAVACSSPENIIRVMEHFGNVGALGYDAVEPGRNVLTFHAWKAIGRHVRKGEHGLPLPTWAPRWRRERLPDGTETGRKILVPLTAFVFHVSQTDGDGGTTPVPTVGIPAAPAGSVEVSQSKPKAKGRKARREAAAVA